MKHNCPSVLKSPIKCDIIILNYGLVCYMFIEKFRSLFLSINYDFVSMSPKWDTFEIIHINVFSCKFIWDLPGCGSIYIDALVHKTLHIQFNHYDYKHGVDASLHSSKLFDPTVAARYGYR